MNIKNKLLTTALTATMLVPMACTNVFAADTPDTISTDVKYSVSQSYEWSIHSAIDFGKDEGVNQSIAKEGNTVSVTNNIIPDGKKLQITVAGSGTDNAFTIRNGSTVLNYTIKEGENNIDTGGTVLDVNAGTNEGSQNLTFTLNTGNAKAEIAGDYTGTVTYTASVVSQ